MPISNGTDCPVGCGRTRACGQLLCRACWREVPAHLQRDVYRTWRSWRADMADPHKFRAYSAAANAAITAVP